MARPLLNFPPMKRPATTNVGGFSLVECMIAVGIVASGFAALTLMNGACIRLMYSAREQMSAGQALQDRMESFRSCTWAQVTDPNYIQSSILNSLANNAPLNGKFTETVTINKYPTPVSPAIQLTRSTSGVVTIVSTNAAIATGDLVKIDIQVAWTRSLGSSLHSEAASTIYGENNQ